MAKYEFDGYDALMREMEADAAEVTRRIDRGLMRGGEIFERALRAEASATFKAPTGELAGKVKADKAVKRLYSTRSVEVYARGTYRGRRGRPRRAATVGFVVEYGRKNMDGNPWNRRASDRSEEAIGRAIEKEMFGT